MALTRGSRIDAADINDLTTRIRNEVTRRDAYWSLTSYTNNYFSVSAGTYAYASQFNNIVIPLNAIAFIRNGVDPGANYIEELESVRQRVISNSSYDKQGAATDCSSACTGLCYTQCTGGCVGGCTSCTGCSNTCTGSCTGSCQGTCKNGCEGCSSCKGTCKGGCQGCSGCSGCKGSCQGSCQGSCSNSCAKRCDQSCAPQCRSGTGVS